MPLFVLCNWDPSSATGSEDLPGKSDDHLQVHNKRRLGTFLGKTAATTQCAMVRSTRRGSLEEETAAKAVRHVQDGAPPRER